MDSRLSQPSPARSPGAARAAAALGLGLALGLAVFEGGARLLEIAPALPSEYGRFVASDILPWQPEPGSHHRGTARSGEFDFDYRHNALGFRDVDHPLEKAPGVFRIVGIGDSFTYGVGAPVEQGYLAQLEAALAARLGDAARIEVINLAVPRYWPEPERLVLEHFGLAYQPDLVIVGVPPNDFNDTRAGLSGLEVSNGFLVTRRARKLGPVAQWLFVHSHALRSVLAASLRSSPKPEPDGEGPSVNDVWEQMHAEHARMVEMAREVGAATLVVHIPQRPPWAAWAPDPPARLARFCEAAACSFVDVLPAARAHPDPASLYHPIDGHCTPAGYGLVAREILATLERDALIPGLAPTRPVAALRGDTLH